VAGVKFGSKAIQMIKQIYVLQYFYSSGTYDGVLLCRCYITTATVVPSVIRKSSHQHMQRKNAAKNTRLVLQKIKYKSKFI